MTVRRLGVAARVAVIVLAVGGLPACAGAAATAGPDLYVTKFDDTADGACLPGDCSLREAVVAANASPGPSTIHLPAGTYSLTIAGNGEEASASGDLDITDSLTIVGVGSSGADGTFIRAGSGFDDRILHVLNGEVHLEQVYLGGGQAESGGLVEVAAPATLDLSQVRLDAGQATGGAGGGLIFNEGILVAEGTRLTNGCSAGPGGGLVNVGKAELTDTTIEDSEAAGAGGAIENRGNLTASNLEISRTFAGSGKLCAAKGESDGGGIANVGDLALTDVQVLRTEAARDGGGIWSSGTLTANGATMRSVAGANGGALAIVDGTAELSGLDLSSTAKGDGGAIFLGPQGTATIRGSLITGVASGNGGGLANLGQATIDESQVTTSRATDGGGLFDSGTLTLTSSTVRLNGSSGRGGGVFADGTLTLDATTVSGNTSDTGGGLFLEGSADGNNCTISGNNASTGGGGVAISGSGDVRLTHCTVSRNASPVASGIQSDTYVTLTNSLIGGNTVGPSCQMRFPPIATGSLDEDGTCQLAEGENLTGVAPNLGSLQNNGGPTETQLLRIGSPARNAADTAECLPTDQRGIARPQGAGCDIGAVEMELGS